MIIRRLAAASLLLATVHGHPLHASWLSEITGVDIDLRPPIKPPQPPLSPPGPVDPGVLKGFNSAQLAYYEHYSKSLASQESMLHTYAVYQWQLLSSKLVFYLVIAIVLSGLALCWLQFLRSSSTKGTAKAADLSISVTGLKVSSPVLGVIVLAISLAFFFCYLQFVYPIRVTNPEPASHASSSSAELGGPPVSAR
jgi:hypothetical protein